MEEGYVRVNNTSIDSEPFQGDGLLVIIVFQILVAEPPGNETDLRTILAFEESRIFTGIGLRGVASEDGLYWLTSSRLIGDLNRDQKVDLKDIGIAAYAYGSFPYHSRWNHVADMNYDDKIDLKDIALIAKHFGETDP